MAEKQHSEVLEPAPYLTANWLGTLVGWGRLVKTPRRLVRGVRRRGKRLWLSRRGGRLVGALRNGGNKSVCSGGSKDRIRRLFSVRSLWPFGFRDCSGVRPTTA